MKFRIPVKFSGEVLVDVASSNEADALKEIRESLGPIGSAVDANLGVWSTGKPILVDLCLESVDDAAMDSDE